MVKKLTNREKNAYKLLSQKIIHFKLDKHYLCNWACGTTPSKSTKDINKVTCKNCLRSIEKGGHIQ